MKSKNKAKKHILMVSRPICLPWDEASKNFTWELAKRIKNFKFHLLTYKKLPEKFSNLIGHSIYTSPGLRLGFLQKTKLVKFLFNIPREIDLLHFLFTPSKLSSSIIKAILKRDRLRGFNRKTIQTIATLDFDKINKANVDAYLFGDKIITHSDFSKKFLENLGLKNVERIYPGVDLEKFKPTPKDKVLMKKLGLTQKEKIILYSGEYARLKAIDDILKAFGQLAKEHSDFKLVLACRIKSRADINKRNEIVKNLKKQNLSNKVVFLGTFSEMPKLYNLADVFLFTPREMKGKFDIALVVLEAMSCSTPVILSNTAALKEVVKIKNSAIVLEKNNVKFLKENILKVLTRKKLAAQIKQKARENCRKYFDMKQSAQNYKKAYQELTK